MTVVKIQGKLPVAVTDVLAPLAEKIYKDGAGTLVGIVERSLLQHPGVPRATLRGLPAGSLRRDVRRGPDGAGRAPTEEAVMARILAIDPGPFESAYVVIEAADCRPVDFGKLANADLLDLIEHMGKYHHEGAIIEMVASYGMAVGAEVFETCVWIGRFYQALLNRRGRHPELVKRLAVKIHHCHVANAKDSNIRQALVDRFAADAHNNGKGTKKAPGWFHGFHADVWQAYALAVYAADARRGPLLDIRTYAKEIA